jgi:hypothetical protein
MAKTSNLRSAIVKDILAPHTTKPEHAVCIACGRSLDPAKAYAGGRARFCTDHCQAAYDAGWPVWPPLRTADLPIGAVFIGPPPSEDRRESPKPKKTRKKATKSKPKAKSKTQKKSSKLG